MPACFASTKARHLSLCTIRGAWLCCAFFSSWASASEARQERISASQIVNTQPTSTQLRSDWHFQVTYGLTPADIETPYWNTSVDPAIETQRSTTGVINQIRYSHAAEFPFNSKQSTRIGLSLLNEQITPSNSWTRSLVKISKAPEWRAWGLGTDLFLVQHSSNQLSLDAGLQADYYLSGVTNLGNAESGANPSSSDMRLEQKSGWRVAFCGGVTTNLVGPLGVITRVSGFVMESRFRGHSKPLRAQGFQLQIGAALALGRGDP